MPEHATDQQLGEVVYVLGTPGSNVVKIGRTTNLVKRLADIQRMSPVPLVALWTCPGGHELETKLHRHFKAIRSHGEWFTFLDDPVPLIRAAVEADLWVPPGEPIVKQRPKAKPTVIDIRPTPNPALLAEQRRRIDLARARVLAHLEAIPDPIDRYRALERTQSVLADQLASTKQASILGLKAGRTWRAVGELIGVSGARAEQISRRAR